MSPGSSANGLRHHRLATQKLLHLHVGWIWMSRFEGGDGLARSPLVIPGSVPVGLPLEHRKLPPFGWKTRRSSFCRPRIEPQR